MCAGTGIRWCWDDAGMSVGRGCWARAPKAHSKGRPSRMALVNLMYLDEEERLLRSNNRKFVDVSASAPAARVEAQSRCSPTESAASVSAGADGKIAR